MSESYTVDVGHDIDDTCTYVIELEPGKHWSAAAMKAAAETILTVSENVKFAHVYLDTNKPMLGEVTFNVVSVEIVTEVSC